jgi:hypothetical protein
MPRPRRSLRRRTYRLRRRWHRAIRPLRRPLGAATFWVLLVAAGAGFVGTVAASYESTSWLRIGDAPRVLDLDVGLDAYASGLRTGDRVLSVDGVAVADSLLGAGRQFSVQGPSGHVVPVEVVRGADTLRVDLVVDALNVQRARAIGLSAASVDAVERALWFLTLAAPIGVAVALYARSRGRGYPADTARSLLTVAAGFGGVEAIDWLDGATTEAVQLVAILAVAGLLLLALPSLAVTLARFPDGRHVPRWTRHIRTGILVGIGLALVLAIGVGVAAAHAGAAGGGEYVVAGFLLASLMGGAAAPLVGLIGKYRRASDRVVRQQMKWVLLPFGTFLGLILVDVLADLGLSWAGVDHTLTEYATDTALGVLEPVAAAAIPLGILAGVLNFRPWDADLWIARSAAVGAATLGLAAVFAGAAEALRLGLRTSMGEGADAVAAALAAVAALVVFNPVREWVTRRADAELHRTRERLTERLPLLLAGRQVVASPAEVGRVAIGAVRDALQTDRAAVLDLDPDGWEVVAADGVARADVEAWADAALDPERLPACSDQVWEDPVFVLRVPLRSAEDELVGVLALGTHGRGRGYSTEERKALDATSRSLAEALRVAERRLEAEARLAERLAALVSRVAEPPAGDGSAAEPAW